MKFIYPVIVVCLATIQSFAQISPSIKAGVGYVHIYDIDDNISPDVHTITSFPSISVEKPFPIEIRLKKRMSINPGLAYHFFKEKEIIGNKTDGNDFRYNHQSLNGYVKVLYQVKLQGNTEAFFYTGGIGGIHLITNMKGKKTIYGLNIENPIIEMNVNENSKGFFDIFYYGFMLGFQPNARKYNFIKPSFEVAFFPGFVSKLQESAQTSYQDINTLQVSVYLGFRIK